MSKQIFLALIAAVVLQYAHAVELHRDTILMGVSFNFSAIHADEILAQEAIDAGVQEVIRIERLISSWDPNSQTSEVNRQAGLSAVVVSPELFDLIRRSKKISQLSNGYFDISFSSIHKIWDMEEFSQDDIPSDEAIRESIDLINFEDIILDETNSTVYLAKKGMRIGFGAIGKGYAANQVKQVMWALGIRSGVINAGGDLLSWGNKEDGSPWRVGIENPVVGADLLSYIESNDMAVVTSGNYKKYLMIDGVRYCHIIDPKTGWPVRGLSSVTVICRDAELADALATTVFVLGQEEGLNLINHLKDVECFLVTESGEQFSSNRIKK